MLGSLARDLDAHADAAKAQQAAQYFKTGPGEYGEGDVFIGLTVPQVRSIAKKYKDIPYNLLTELITHKVHEYRLCALLILVHRYEHVAEEREQIYTFYKTHLAYINNWDLVDTSAAPIVGVHLLTRSRKQLYTWAQSKNVWERRIAVVATHTFIKAHQFADTTTLVVQLKDDRHDLMHKAMGWMLREIGKQSTTVLEAFLREHAHELPRTTVRYAIEHFSETKRSAYLTYGKKIPLPAAHAPFSHKHSVLFDRIRKR